MPVLDISDLKKSFVAPDGERTDVIDVPALRVEAGQQLALRGSSGSGKTTLLHIIAGILKPDSGRVTVAGCEMTGAGESTRDRLRAETIGYVFQTFNLLQGYTALENVMLGMLFGKGVDHATAVSLLERVGLSHRLHYRPRQMSVGQQQRVAVARALANRPQLVLADEPTGNLDRHHAREALALIRQVCADAGAALLLVSHDPEVLGSFEHSLDLAQVNRAARVMPPDPVGPPSEAVAIVAGAGAGTGAAAGGAR
jgi:putative ABC transport system ATP-binding protein